MCNKCKGQLKLVSYKWSDDKFITYKYKCDKCNEIMSVVKKYDETELKNLMFDFDLYDNL